MNILVIGSSDQVASSLLELAPKGMQVSCVGRPEADLENPHNLAQIFAKFQSDIVVNAAAYTAVDKAESEAEKAFAINATGVEQLAKLCKKNSIPFIYISTDYVFDGTKSEPYKESDAVAPLGIYGKSKLVGEQLLAKACSRYIILRTAWIYSRFGNNFLKTMLRLASTRDEISVVSDQIGSPTYAPHLAKAIFDIIPLIIDKQPDDDIWGIYHCAGSGEASWYDFANEIFNQSGNLGGKKPMVHAINSEQFPTPVKRPANSRLDGAKLLKTFNIALPNWRIGTKQCIKQLYKGNEK